MELLCGCLLLTVLAGMAVPQALAALSRARTLAAARYLAARMQGARGQAAARSTHVGLRVVTRGDDLIVSGFRDGNHNGIRAADIASGVDAQVDPELRLGDLFPGVRAGASDGSVAPPLDGEEVSTFSFGPTGTASSGTVYIRGRDEGQYAVRVLGATGRVRVLRFRAATRDWVDVR